MSQIGRNEECPCGSGIKYKRCCLNRKQRKTTVRFELLGNKMPAGMVFKGPGNIEIVDSQGNRIPHRAYLEKSYDRPKGPKILSQVPMLGDKIYISPNDELIKYDHIFAIDTNSNKYRDNSISIAATVYTEKKNLLRDGVFMDVKSSGMYEFRGLPIELAEKYAWRHLLNILDADPDFKNRSIAIIVDSALSELGRINHREQPIIDDYYLPSNRALFYASADSGGEIEVNKLMRDCDRFARSLYNEITTDPESISGSYLIKDKYGTDYSVWIEKPVE